MKRPLLIMLLMVQLAFVTKIYSQNIAINGTGALPDNSAMLDVSSINTGFLAPRMTTIQRDAIVLPANGLLIFNTTDNLFYVNTGIPSAKLWVPLSITSSNWNITGNSAITQPAAPITYGTTPLGATENFLGNKDARDLVMATNNLERMRILNASGNVGIGVADPAVSLVVNNNIQIRRPIVAGTISQLIFTNTSGTGDFRLGGDGGDIYWQGGGGRSLQMGSYWATVLGGDRQTAVFPAFVTGITNTSVIVASQRTPSVALGIQGFAGQTANLTEWRNAAAAVLSSVNNLGDLGLGTSTPAQKLHVVGQAIITNLTIGAVTDSIVTWDPLTGLLKKRMVSSVVSGAAITSINGLTATAQTFTTGTAGTDFNISSASPVHTFNLPTASATNRGALSTADWSTFNNKQNVLIAGTDYLTPTGSAAGLISFPTLNQNTTGNAATVTTNANLTGEVTSAGNATTVTNAAVIAKVLTGYISGAGAVAATDNILQAVQKINGNDILKAPIASPTLTGVPLAPTAIAGTNTTQIATTAFVTSAVSGGTAATVITNANLTGEVTSVGNATTVTNAAVIAKVLTGYISGAGAVAATDNILQAVQKINGNDALKAPIASPALTGTPLAPTATLGTNTTQIATTAFVASAINGSSWTLKGNSGITQPVAPVTYGTSTLGAGENFLGTPDAKDLVLATNNLERMRILNTNGWVGIGTSVPVRPLSIISNISGNGVMLIENSNSGGYSSIDFADNTGLVIGNVGYSNAGGTYGNSYYFATNQPNPMAFATNNTERIRILATGNVGIGTTLPTAVLQLKSGTAAAGTAPLKLGVNAPVKLTTPEKYAIEIDSLTGSSNIYWTDATATRYILAKTLTNTASLTFASTPKFSASDLTIAVSGAVLGDVVLLGVPSSSVVTSSCYTAFVSLPGVVTVRFNNYLDSASPTPGVGTFRVSIIKY